MNSQIIVTLYAADWTPGYSDFIIIWNNLQVDSDIIQINPQFVISKIPGAGIFLALKVGDNEPFNYSEDPKDLIFDKIKDWILNRNNIRSIVQRSNINEIQPGMSTSTKVKVGLGIGAAAVLLGGLFIANKYSKEEEIEAKPGRYYSYADGRSADAEL